MNKEIGFNNIKLDYIYEMIITKSPNQGKTMILLVVDTESKAKTTRVLKFEYINTNGGTWDAGEKFFKKILGRFTVIELGHKSDFPEYFL